jgi:hypothetical protein
MLCVWQPVPMTMKKKKFSNFSSHREMMERNENGKQKNHREVSRKVSVRLGFDISILRVSVVIVKEQKAKAE